MDPILGPWGQFENFTNWSIWEKARFMNFSVAERNGHSLVIFVPIDPNFLQTEAKSYIYEMQGHLGPKLFILVPDFEVRKVFAFSILTAPGPGHRIFWT